MSRANIEMREMSGTMRGAANSSYCCNTAANGRNRVILNQAERDTFKCLLKDARRIEAGATLPIVLKVFRFFLDEGSPIVLFYMTLKAMIYDASWEKAGVPLLINVITSTIIAYSICNEKREVCTSRQGESWRSLTHEIACKTCSLMFNWVNDLCRRSKKRETKIDLIESNTFQDDSSTFQGDHKFWLNREALSNLTKFYSSHLRYLREDILVITLRSFCISICHLYNLVDTRNLALPMCGFFDIMRVLFVLWIILNTSYIAKNFHDAKKQYVAAQQLWASSWAGKNSDPLIRIPAVVPEYKRFRDFELNFDIKFLGIFPYLMDLSIYAVLIAARYLVIILLLVSTKLFGVVIWYVLMMLGNTFLLDWLRSSRQINICNEFDYAPVGFSRKRHKWIDRFVTNIFFNYSYSPNALRGWLKWKTLFNIVPTILFLIIYFAEGNFKMLYPTEHNLTNTTLTSNYNNASLLYVDVPASMTLSRRSETCTMNSYIEPNFSLKGFTGLLAGTKNCIDRQLGSNPINTVQYFGGLEFGAIVVLLLLLISFGLEISQNYLLKLKKINLESFEIFPFFDAIDCYRSLIKAVGNNEDFMELDSFSYKLMILTLLDESQFETAWSYFHNFDQWNSVNPFSHFCKERSKEYTTWILGNCRGVINNEATELRSRNLSSINLNAENLTEIEELELGALRLAKRFFSIDHPLEPHTSEHDIIREKHLFSQIFIRVRNPGNEANKERDLKLFIAFLNVLDTRLCQMTSYRIQRTFDMLRIEIGKTYEDVGR